MRRGFDPCVGKIPAREGNGNPLHYFCLGNPMDRGAWWAAVHGFANSGYYLGTEHTCIKVEKVWAEVTENLECQAEYKQWSNWEGWVETAWNCFILINSGVELTVEMWEEK